MAATSFQENTAGGGRAGETTSAGAGTGGGSQEGLHIIGRERLSDWGAGGGLGGRDEGRVYSDGAVGRGCCCEGMGVQHAGTATAGADSKCGLVCFIFFLLCFLG